MMRPNQPDAVAIGSRALLEGAPGKLNAAQKLRKGNAECTPSVSG
jgi:hypothetical protein